MTNRPLLLLLAMVPCALRAAETPPVNGDLLRFVTGDQLQGTFKGIDTAGKITWTRPDVPQPIEFQRDKVRQIVLRGGQPATPAAGANHVALVNGDRIPCQVVSMDEAKVSIQTDSAGMMTVPRDAVASLSPNPFGGRLIYAGPFDESSWKVIDSAPPTPDEVEEAKKADPPAKPRELAWKHAGAAWYSRPGNDALILQADMPERSMVRFKLGSRGSPGISFAFDADFARPEPDKDARNANSPNTLLSRMFGNAYVLSIYPSFAQLYRCGLDKDKKALIPERIRSGNSNFSIKPTGETLFEVRRDRKAATVALYIDGEFALQWDTKPDTPSDQPAPGGSGIGFQATGNSSPIRLSDIVAAEWNGLTDSARSMESEQSDIVLLANGTDRFSGHVTSIQDGKLAMDGRYTGMTIPMEDVAEVHLATASRRKVEEDPKASDLTVHFKPVGRITGIPAGSSGDHLKLSSTLAGDLDLDLKSAVILEFQSMGGFLDKWDDDF